MKKILVLSDTHKNFDALKSLEHLFESSDYIMHLGDHSSDLNIYKEKYRDKIFTVNGNCDFFTAGKDELIIDIENVKIMLCHGHKYRVKQHLNALKSRAEQMPVDLCLFGHTHKKTLFKDDRITYLNPGALERYSAIKSYGLVTVSGKEISAQIIDF